MKIHEYQGKELFRKFGVTTPRGVPAFSVDEALDAAKKLGGSVWVVKAQIHAGGARGLVPRKLERRPALADARLERAGRSAQINTFGGGVNEVQREIVATAGLKMTRQAR